MSLVSAITLWSVSSWRPGLHFSKEKFRELFEFGGKIVGLNIMTYLKTRSDDLLIGYFLGPVALGYYTVAYRLMRMVLELLQSIFGGVSFPIFARLQNKPEELQQAFLRFVHTIALLSFPAFTIMIVMAPTIIAVLFGEQWMPSAVIMQILNMAGFTMSLGYFSSNILVATNQPGLVLRLDVLLTILSIVAFFIATPYGIVWVAIAFTSVRIPYFFVYLWFVHKQIRFSIRRYATSLVAPSIAASLMGAVAFALNRGITLPVLPIVELATFAFVSVCVYLAALLALQPSLVHQLLRPVVQTVLRRGV
jgi:PST family polysaccharide transporter